MCGDGVEAFVFVRADGVEKRESILGPTEDLGSEGVDFLDFESDSLFRLSAGWADDALVLRLVSGDWEAFALSACMVQDGKLNGELFLWATSRLGVEASRD